jgi:hypothetical protein
MYVYMRGCVQCHVYFSTFVFANESWFCLCSVVLRGLPARGRSVNIPRLTKALHQWYNDGMVNPEVVWRPIKSPQLTLRHRHARFDCSHDHLGWTIRTWRGVHWSDEGRFLLRPTDGRARVWRQRNTSFQDNHILGLSDYHQERASPTYNQGKNNPRQLHPHPQKQLCPKCGCPEMWCTSW